MFTDDEKDYIMSIIKEVARVLASVMLGKKYVQVELPVESKYQISGDKLHHLKTMVDNGEINEAENELLKMKQETDRELAAMDAEYSQNHEKLAAAIFDKMIGE